MSGTQISLKDQNGRPVFDSLKDIVKEQLSKILSAESVQTAIKESSEKLRVEMLNNWKEENKDFDTITIGSNQISMDQAASLSKTNVKEKPLEASSRISEEIGKTMINHIPSEFSGSLIQYLTETITSILALARDPDEFLSSITEEKINEILQSVKIPYLTFSLQNVEITTRDNNQLKCNFNFKTNSIHPFVKISSEPPFIINPLFKMTLKIDLDGTITDIQVEHKNEKFLVSLGIIDVKFTVAIKEVKVINKTIISSKENENEDNSRKLLEKKFKKELPQFSIP